MNKLIEKIPDGMHIVMNYPRIHCMMTGILKAAQWNDGTIKLLYEDYSEETRKADFYIEDKTCFEVVSFVQNGRTE